MYDEKDFKGRARVPRAVGQNSHSNTAGPGGGAFINPKTDTTDGAGRFRDSVPGAVDLDNAGLQVGGYITKKNLNIGGMGADVRLNFLPPGMYIDNQENADIRPIQMKEIVKTSGYPGDGWTGKGSEDIGI